MLFVGGKTGYISDTGIESIGRMLQHFIELSTLRAPEKDAIPAEIAQFVFGHTGWFGVSQLILHRHDFTW